MTAGTLDIAALERVHALVAGPDLAQLDVADLADAAGYSLHHFSRSFRSAVGVSPGRYLTAQRIGAAKRLLLMHDEPVIDIAAEVGFASLSSFARRFHLAVGLPPAELRQLADEVADARFSQFALCAALEGPADPRAVDIGFSFPGVTPPASMGIWAGWFPGPAPIGLPSAGMLAIDNEEIRLPVCPGSPWLLAFAVSLTDDPVHHLAPASPMTAVHPAPITAGTRVQLRFSVSEHPVLPLLPALPVLRRRLSS